VVEETLEPGASVAKVAFKYGVNANQVFQWRRLYRDGKLGGAPANAIKLLPVSVVEDKEPLRPEPVGVPCSSPCAIHIELPGDIRISLEGSVDQDLVRTVLKSLRA
jgi:transposase